MDNKIKTELQITQSREKSLVIEQRKLNKTFIAGFGCFILLSITSQAVADEDLLKINVRNEIRAENGVLVSQPKTIDKKINAIIEVNNIRSLEDYSMWLKANVKYQKDGQADIWANPLETLKKQQGDCEDFAFLTLEILKGLGYQPRFLALVKQDKAHAICVFEKDGYYMWFDNGTLKKTGARTLEDFASSIMKNNDFLQLSELDMGSNSWHTVYKKS